MNNQQPKSSSTTFKREAKRIHKIECKLYKSNNNNEKGLARLERDKTMEKIEKDWAT